MNGFCFVLSNVKDLPNTYSQSRCSRPAKPRRRAFNANYFFGSLAVVDPVGASPTEIGIENSSVARHRDNLLL
jgi:hypothetical protein